MCDVGSFRNEETYPETIYLHAICLYLGLGTEKNAELHSQLLIKVVDFYDYLLAINALGQSYESGVAADQGDINAYYRLGYCYTYGLGVIEGYKESARYFEMAALRGCETSEHCLGWC